MKTKKILKNSFSLFILALLLLFFAGMSCAATIGNTKWAKSGNSAYAAIDKQPAVAATASVAATTTVTTAAQPAAQVTCSYTYAFEKPTFVAKNNYDRVYIKGLSDWDGNPGAPILPFKHLTLLIPNGQKLVGVRVNPGSIMSLPGLYKIGPAQEPISLNRIGEKIEPTLPDSAIYGSSDIYPSVPCGDAFLQKKEGYSILILNLFPVQYVPKTGVVSYYDRMTVQLETTAPIAQMKAASVAQAGMQTVVIRPRTGAMAEIRSMVDNPEVCSSYLTTTQLSAQSLTVQSSQASTASDQYEYVIITTDALRDMPNQYNFQDLIAAKRLEALRQNLLRSKTISIQYTPD